jgi:hypothetical protein
LARFKNRNKNEVKDGPKKIEEILSLTGGKQKDQHQLLHVGNCVPHKLWLAETS